MGEMELFFKCNKEERENREMPVCSALKDENGNIVMWHIRHLTTDERFLMTGENVSLICQR